jgi:platelet-activating factor acetylhydrolase IB subunit alpha
LELENKVAQYEQEIHQKRTAIEQAKELLPRGPPRHMLKGHRDAVTAVRFHPEFDLVISASEDATLRLWDFESGSIEYTFKVRIKFIQPTSVLNV